jgi:hypothetical protein
VKRENLDTSHDSAVLRVINKVVKVNTTLKNLPIGFIEVGRENERIVRGTSLNPDL